MPLSSIQSPIPAALLTMRRLMRTVAWQKTTLNLLATHTGSSQKAIRSWSRREVEQALAELTITLAERAGKQYDADRESPPLIDDTLHRAIWKVYLTTRNARTRAALEATEARHR